MKKIVKVSVLVLALCMLLGIQAFAAEPVFKPNSNQYLSIDGELRAYALPVAGYNGSTLLPLRLLVTDLGIPNDDEHIQYDAATKSVTLITADGSKKIWLQQGNTKAWVEENGVRTDLTLVCPVQSYQGHTYIPVRFVAESLGMFVTYDNDSRTVIIRTPESLAAVTDALAISEAAEQPSKMQMVMSGGISAAAEGETIEIPYEAAMEIDMSDLNHMKMKMNMAMEMEGISVPIDMYMDGTTVYMSMLGQVVKMSAEDSGMDMSSALEMASIFETSGLAAEIEQEMMARLFAKEGEVEGQTVISGDMSMLYSKSLGLLEMLGTSIPEGTDLNIGKLWIEMTIDTASGLPVALCIDLVMGMDGTEMSMHMDMEFGYDDIDIVIPKEIIDNAVEM